MLLDGNVDPSTKSHSSVASIFDRQKSPMAADKIHKEKMKTNPPPIRKWESRGKSASHPKGIEPFKWVPWRTSPEQQPDSGSYAI